MGAVIYYVFISGNRRWCNYHKRRNYMKTFSHFRLVKTLKLFLKTEPKSYIFASFWACVFSDDGKWTVTPAFCNVLTMSSVASLAAVTDSTRTSGTTVVNQDSEEIWGITWRAHTQAHARTHTINPNLFLTRWGNFLSWMLLSVHPRPV